MSCYDETMARGARAFAVVAVALLVSCNAVLGLRDIEEGATAPDGGSTPPSGNDAAADSPSDATLAERDALVEAGPSGACAAYPGALLCDDFESGGFDPRWQLIQQGTAFAKVVKRNGAVDGGANQREGYFGFSPIPDVGVSAIAFPLANGRRSLRFEVNVPLNGWPPSGVGIAGMLDADQKGLRVVAEQLGTAPWKFVVRSGDGDGGALVTEIGYVVAGQWTCLEIEVQANGTLRAWQGTALSVGTVSPTLATTPLRAEVGMMWSSIGNPGSKYVEFDNVVVGTGMVGCP